MRRPLALLLAVGVLLAGCGGGDGGGDYSSDLAKALEATKGAESYRVKMKLESDLGGQEISMEGEGISAPGDALGRFEMDMAIGGGAPQPVEMIIDDGVNYMRGGPFEQVLPAGKKWLRVPDDTRTMSPTEFIDFLQGTSDVEEVGTEEVNGEQAVHLRGPLDMEKLAEKAGSSVARQFEQIPNADEIDATIDVWIGEEKALIWRLRTKLSHPDAPGSMEVSADLLDYGVSLKGVKPPPAAQVADGSQLGG